MQACMWDHASQRPIHHSTTDAEGEILGLALPDGAHLFQAGALPGTKTLRFGLHQTS